MRRLLPALLLLVGLFCVSLELREPWRGHMAPGDHWVTGQTLRFVSAWREEGAWASRFALVLTPPNAVETPEKKWGLPGHHLLVHGALGVVGAAPDVEALMRLNLATQLLLVLLLATLAYALSRNAWIGEPRTAPIAAFHCGAFALLLPAMFYWGQNLSVQYLTILPLFAFCVSGRWLRAAATSPGARRAIDAGVALCVFWGVVTDFLFWLVVPYLLGMQLLRTWRDRPRPDDPWVWTLAVPFFAACLALLLLFWANGQLGDVEDRFGRWVGDGSARERAGVLSSLARKPLYFAVFLSRHFWEAYVGGVGMLCLALAAWKLPRRRTRGLSPSGAGLLVDLSLPCVLFVLAIGKHQVIHATSAMKFLPFVALTWTLLVPALLPTGRWRGRVAAAVYAAVAFLLLCPFTNGFQRYFPEPSVAFEREARRVRESTRPTDAVVSEEIEISPYPPQRIAVSERRVAHVYGPLDLYHAVQGPGNERRLALYRAPRLASLLGVTPDPDRPGDDELRFVTTTDLFAFLDTQPYGPFLRDMGRILEDFPPSDPALRPHEPLRPLTTPVGIHAIVFSTERTGGTRMHWRDARHFHRLSRQGESVTIDDVTWSRGRIWRAVPDPDAGDVAWATDLLDSVERARAETDPSSFSWRGHAALPLGPQRVPAELVGGAEAWESFLFVRGGTPFGLCLAPAAHDGQREPVRIVVLFDPFEGEITRPSPVEPPQWRVEKRPELGYLRSPGTGAAPGARD